MFAEGYIRAGEFTCGLQAGKSVVEKAKCLSGNMLNPLNHL